MPAASASALDIHWSGLLDQLLQALDPYTSARAAGVLVRRRNVGDAWPGISNVADISDVALRRRIQGADGWLGQIAGALLPARSPAGDVLPVGQAPHGADLAAARGGDPRPSDGDLPSTVANRAGIQAPQERSGSTSLNFPRPCHGPELAAGCWRISSWL